MLVTSLFGHKSALTQIDITSYPRLKLGLDKHQSALTQIDITSYPRRKLGSVVGAKHPRRQPIYLGLRVCRRMLRPLTAKSKHRVGNARSTLSAWFAGYRWHCPPYKLGRARGHRPYSKLPFLPPPLAQREGERGWGIGGSPTPLLVLAAAAVGR